MKCINCILFLYFCSWVRRQVSLVYVLTGHSWMTGVSFQQCRKFVFTTALRLLLESWQCLLKGYWGLFLWDMTLTTHLYTVPTSRELWTLPPLPQCTLLLLRLQITTIFFLVYFLYCYLTFVSIVFIHSLECFRFGGYLQFYWSHRQRNWQDAVSSSHTSSTQSCIITACNSSPHYYLNSSHDGTVGVTSSQPGLYTAAHI